MFVIEDDEHAKELGRYRHRADAITELRRLAQLPWDVSLHFQCVFTQRRGASLVKSHRLIH